MFCMSMSSSNLRRAQRREEQLSKELVHLEKSISSEMKKIERIMKKRNKTNADVRRQSRSRTKLLTFQEDRTKLLNKIGKNNRDIQKYQERVSKEQNKQYEKLLDEINANEKFNKEQLNRTDLISEQIQELSVDVKNSVADKEVIEYDVFLSHSSLDKEIFVSELSRKLSAKGLKVFEDVKVFKIGDSQTDMMNMGIFNSRFVVVFLSHNFFESGWSDYEFKSFLNREINEKKIIILPIWHQVSYEDVKNYNPYLVDKFALDTQKFSMNEIVSHINDVATRSVT